MKSYPIKTVCCTDILNFFDTILEKDMLVLDTLSITRFCLARLAECQVFTQGKITDVPNEKLFLAKREPLMDRALFAQSVTEA